MIPSDPGWVRAGDNVGDGYIGNGHIDIIIPYMGMSENSVPLNPMVLLIIIPIKWL